LTPTSWSIWGLLNWGPFFLILYWEW
jgi:hypothetical protein